MVFYLLTKCLSSIVPFTLAIFYDIQEKFKYTVKQEKYIKKDFRGNVK